MYSQKEEKRYKYHRPGPVPKTNRFTNNVWKLTTEVGFGVGKAKYKGVLMYFVVAYFFPKGNDPADYARNVLPKGSVSSSTSEQQCDGVVAREASFMIFRFLVCAECVGLL